MLSFDISVSCSIMALLRGDLSPSYIADRFGVTEREVLEWRDIFLVAGTMALANIMRSAQAGGSSAQSQSKPSSQSQGHKQASPKKGGIGEVTTTPVPCPDRSA